MFDLSMTTFVDFSTKAGRARITEVRNYIDSRGTPYNPAKDYWRDLRNLIIEHHKNGLPPSTLLEEFDKQIKNSKKRVRYRKNLQAYRRFLGKRELEWFDPPFNRWHHGALSVRVNPEIGLLIDGVPHVIKLYLKDDRLNESRVASCFALMQEALADEVKPGTVLGVLNCNTGKLYTSSADHAIELAVLQGDADAFLRLCMAHESA